MISLPAWMSTSGVTGHMRFDGRWDNIAPVVTAQCNHGRWEFKSGASEQAKAGSLNCGEKVNVLQPGIATRGMTLEPFGCENLRHFRDHTGPKARGSVICLSAILALASNSVSLCKVVGS